MEKNDSGSEQTHAQDTDKALELDRSLSENTRIGKRLDQFRLPVMDPRIARAIEPFRSPMLDPQIAKAIEQFRSPMLDPQIAKAIEQFRSPMLDPQIAKAIEQFRSPMLDPQIAKAIEQFRSPMLDPQIAKAIEQFRSPMLDPQIAKAIEQFRSPMLDPQIAKAIEQFGAVLQDSSIGKLIEQSRSALANTQLGKQFQNSYSQVGSALAGASVAALLEELESRRTDFTGERGSEAEPPPRRIDAEGHATVSVTATGDGRVEKSKTQDIQLKTQDLSSIPTWFIRLVLHLLLHSIQLLGQWEQIRESVVDLNARAPKTESFYELRNFIRTKLSGKPGDIRLVTGSNVNLRLDPGMKSEIIIALPKNSIVVVQGKEDRTWLLVSYELEGYWVDGYVSTKYLKKVRKTPTP